MAEATNRRTALVTGASSGIGLELAKLLAADGHDLILVARDEERLRELGRGLERDHRVDTHVIARDLARPGAAAGLLAEIAKLGIDLDVLVNNAGFGLYGPFAEADVDRVRDMIQVNVLVVTELARGVLPAMLSRGSGRILNLASTAAFQPGPLMAVYYATKAFVLSFSEAISNEVSGSGVTVTALCPGPTITEFQARAGIGATRLFRGPLVMDAARVARAGYAGLKRGKRVVIPGLPNRLLVQALRITPRRLATAVARRIQETRT